MSLDLRETLTAEDAQSTSSHGSKVASGSPIRLLAYVHLRNIHASTGAGRVARLLTEHLAKRNDIELQVLADRADHDRVLPLVGEPWQSFRYQTFPSDTSRQQARWFAFESPKAERFWPDAEVVYCAGESYVPATKASLAVTVHDAAYFEQGAHRQGQAFWRQRFKWKLLFNRLAARVDMIHTVSQFSADRLTHFFPTLANRIRVVPNAVTPHFFEAVSEMGVEFLLNNGLYDRSYILVPGGLSFRKNADLIVAAAPLLLAQHPDILLVISGHSDPAYASRLAQSGLPVKVLGFVDDAALHALYAHAVAVWFPSLYEGFGMPVLEAMASGSPVVASSSSSIPEIANNAALLAAPDKCQDHVELLTALIEDGSLRDRIRSLGRTRAAHFTWPKSAETLTRCFEEIR